MTVKPSTNGVIDATTHYVDYEFDIEVTADNAWFGIFPSRHPAMGGKVGDKVWIERISLKKAL